jgi:hypothetical protein
MIRRLALPVVLALSAVLSGCVEEDRVAYVQSVPPPEAAEVVAVAPTPDHVFIRGHWEWNGTRYVFKRGRYIRRPHDYAVWVEGHWQNTDRGWYWQGGHWGEAQARKVVVGAPHVYATPPPATAEVEEDDGTAAATPRAAVPPAPAYLPPPPPPSRALPPGAAQPQRYVAPAPGAEY